MKNVLLYVEPWVELSPDFRYDTFCDALYLRRILSEHRPDLDVRLLIGENLRDMASLRKAPLLGVPVHVLSQHELKNIHPDYRAAARSAISEDDHTANAGMATLVKKALGDFQPDVILMHETHAPFFKTAFADVLVLHSMFGLSYRAPYPMLTMLDPAGLYQRSTLARHAEEIRAIEVSAGERKALAHFRGWMAEQQIPHDPVWPLIERHQSRFERLVLLPLQVDGYFAFDECSPYRSQQDLVEAVLEKVPHDWGVIVTTHGKQCDAMNDHIVSMLSRRYTNVIWEPAFSRIPNASQAILPHVDAVVTVSSSLAYQALFYGVPVVAAGDSHVNALSSCRLAEVDRLDALHAKFDADPILKFLLTRYHHVTARHIHDGAGLLTLVQTMHEAHRTGKRGIEFFGELRTVEAASAEIRGQSQWRAYRNALSEAAIEIHPHPVLNKIVFADAVSYDLFDTLVQRPFIEPHEVFQFIEIPVRSMTRNSYFPFHHMRREAERMARAAVQHRTDITHDEIYAQLELLTGYPKEMLDRVKQLELDTELSVIGRKRGMCRTWEMCTVWGKPKSIITDIYLEEPFIQQVLEKNGLADYDTLLVSATERSRKEDGTIYPLYLSKIRTAFPSAKKLLHIGDNPRADVEMAKRHGLQTCLIPKAMDLLRRTQLAKVWERAMRAPNSDSSLIIGLTANRFFSAPTTAYSQESATDGSLFNFGYAALGPYVLGYVQWVIRRMRANKVDRAFFLARDGHLMRRVYDEVRTLYGDLPEAGYLYCSRRGVAVPTLLTQNDKLEVATLNFGSTTVANFLDSRFGVRLEQVPEGLFRSMGLRADGQSKLHYPRDLSVAVKLVNALDAVIDENSQRERDTYMEYLKREGAADPTSRTAFIDIGYSGTMQRRISMLTGQRYFGFYMLTHNYVLDTFREQVYESWLEDYDNQRATYRHEFNNWIPLIESLLSSEEGSFVRFDRDQNGELVRQFVDASNEGQRIAFLRALHAGAMAFVRDWRAAAGSLANATEISPRIAAHALHAIAANPTRGDVLPFEGLILENNFAGSEFSVIANPMPYLNASGKLARATYDTLVGESKWKEGAAVALASYLEPSEQKHMNQAAAMVAAAAAPEATARYALSKKERMRRKLRNSPYNFFADSKSRLVRPVRHVFGRHWVGNLATNALRRRLDAA